MNAEVQADILQRRLWAQRLVGAPCASPQEAVGRLCAVQAQDFAAAKWAVARRALGATDALLDQAYDDGDILRTHVLRPTWHFVLPADIRMLLAVTAPRIRARDAHRYRELGLGERTLGRSLQVLEGELADGKALTRREIATLLAAAGIGVEGQRLPYILMNAELAGLICSGRRRHRQHTYALLAERAPGLRVVSREEALGQLAARYVAGHGPATLKDFARWASLTQVEARLGLEAAGRAVTPETTGGLTLWSAPGPAAPAPVSPTVRLIQGYDEYVMGYSETKSLLARPGSTWSPRTPAVFSLVALFDGFMAGFWRKTVARGLVTIEVATLDAFEDGAWQALVDEASLYGRFLGLPVQIVRRRS